MSKIFIFEYYMFLNEKFTVSLFVLFMIVFIYLLLAILRVGVFKSRLTPTNHTYRSGT